MNNFQLDCIKKRPLVMFAMALTLGILAAQTAGSLKKTLLATVFSVILFFALTCATKILFDFEKSLVIGMIIFFSIGAFRFMLLEDSNRSGYSPYDGQTVFVMGYVASGPEIKDSKVSYIIRPLQVSAINDAKNEGETDNGTSKSEGYWNLMLATMLEDGQNILEYGSRVTFEGKLVKPSGIRNPGGFDYRAYLARKGVAARIFSLNVKLCGDMKTSWPTEQGLRLKERIISVIEDSLPKQQAGLLGGILIGSRDGLTTEVEDAFSDAGLTHIMAVSGANIAFIVLPLAFLLKKLRIPKAAANISIICFLIVFVFITGSEPSVLRAVIMASFILVGQILMRDSDILTIIAASAVVLLLYSPYMLFNIGFQLSFSATISLVLLFNDVKKLIHRKYIPGKIADVLAATITAQLGVLPLTLVYFNRVSVISVLTNLLVVPLLEAVTIIGMAMAVLGLIYIGFSQLLGFFNCTLLSFILYVVKLSSRVPFAVLTTVTPPAILIIAYYPVIFLLLRYGPIYKAKVSMKNGIALGAATAVIISALFVLPGLVPKGLEVVFLDVGEGDCIFVRTRTGRTVLIDGGGSANPERTSRVGETVVLPFLLDNGVTSLDTIIATHGHTDHVQGLIPVMDKLEVKNLILPEVPGLSEQIEQSDQLLQSWNSGFEDLLDIAMRKDINVALCSKGDIIHLDEDTCLNVMNPPNPSEAGNYISNVAITSSDAFNNTSLVVKLVCDDVKILFTGDAGSEVEDRLLEEGADIKADVIKIAHHGSRTSTGIPFLNSVNPIAAVICVGSNNFGHPSQKVISGLTDAGIMIFRTDTDGAVVIRMGGKFFRHRAQRAMLRISRMVNSAGSD